MKLQIKKGSTSVRAMVFISDSSSTTGAGKTGLAYNSPGIKWYYWRSDTGNNNGVAVTLANATRGTFTSGGFKEIDATNLPGWYEIGIPDAALASGSKSVAMMLHGVTNMAPLPIEIQLVAYDPENATTLGLTNLDATISSRFAAASAPANFSSLGINSSGHLSRVVLCDTITTYTGNTPQTGDAYARIGANGSGLTSVADTSGVTTLLSRLTGTRAGYLDNLSGGAVALASGVVVTTNNDKTGYGLSSGERTTLANVIEAEIIDDTDSEKVLTAITDKIASVNPSLGSLTVAAIASQVRTELATELARIDVAISTRLASASYAAPLDAAGVRTAVGLGSANLDTQLAAIVADTNELQTDWVNDGRLDAILDARASQSSVDSVPSEVNNWTGIASADGIYGKITSLKSTMDNLDDVIENNSGTYRFTAAALALAPGGTPPTAAAIAEEIFSTANGINTGESFRQWARRVRAVLYGKTSGMRTGTEVFKAADGTTTLVSVTVDRKGNRSGVTLT